MVEIWQHDCTAVILASGDSYIGLCPKQEFQQESELKCKVIPR